MIPVCIFMLPLLQHYLSSLSSSMHVVSYLMPEIKDMCMYV